MNTTEKFYDVIIFEKASRVIDTVIGKQMPLWDGTGTGRNTADLRVQTGKERINEHYECEMVEAGKYKKGDVLPLAQ